MSRSEVGCPATDRTNDSEVSATPDKMALSPPPICGLERAPSPGKYMPQACVSKAGVARGGAATPWGCRVTCGVPAELALSCPRSARSPATISKLALLLPSRREHRPRFLLNQFTLPVSKGFVLLTKQEKYVQIISVF